MSVGTPTSLQNAVGKNMSAATLRNDMGGAQYVALQCTNGYLLNGAYLCTINNNGVPGGKEICPSDVQKEDTCTSSTITIPAFK